VLASVRPTAVNLARAVDRVVGSARSARSGALGDGAGGDPRAIADAAFREAVRIDEEERDACAAIGRLGSDLVPGGATVLTHCNTGTLATNWEGTAQAVITAAFDRGLVAGVLADETRPLLQGARLTAWELQRRGVPVTLLADAAAGSVMARGLVDLVVVGADRIAANGDVANKIGTYPLAVMARRHGIPFVVAAPLSTVDPATPNGSAIPIEDRDPTEVTTILGRPVSPAGSAAIDPAFDVTPAALVSAIVTDAAVVRPPYRRELARVLGARRVGGAGPGGART
jgi:methylthioribose-1-phosphate isomerase